MTYVYYNPLLIILGSFGWILVHGKVNRQAWVMWREHQIACTIWVAKKALRIARLSLHVGAPLDRSRFCFRSDYKPHSKKARCAISTPIRPRRVAINFWSLFEGVAFQLKDYKFVF